MATSEDMFLYIDAYTAIFSQLIPTCIWFYSRDKETLF
jgi:hypothetical protein